MGCAGSKLEELNAVALCRERSDLLAEAIRHRYALADAHAAYADSLRSVGAALHRFLDGAHLQGSAILSLPAQRKGDPFLPPSPAPPPPASAAAAEGISSAHSRSRSQSGSHIHFHSSDDSESDGDLLLHSDSDSPVHLHTDHHELLSGPTYFNVHYARSNPPPTSVSFEQRVESPERVHYGSVTEPSSSSSYYVYQPSNYGYHGMGGFFGSQSPPAAMSQAPPNGSEANSKASTSRAALLPPSPPRTSTWDFLNPFESFESYYPPYTPSRTSKEAREDEGIPDLEEDEQEVIKEAYVDQNFVAYNSAAAMPEYSSKGASASGENVGSSVEASRYDLRKKEDEAEVVEKNVVGGAVQKPHDGRSVAAPRRYHDVSEVASEIRVHFERAADSTKYLARLLEVGKLPYIRKKSVFAASSRMMCLIPALMSKDEDLVYDEDKVMSTGNLSSTLQKLYIWEQKLHAEVRVEEKMRLLHDRNSKKLKRLDVRGAEAHKIEATQTFVRKLSTKIRIAIQIVNSITTKIDALRDEELWPQIEGIIQGFERMWGVMLECHQIQNQAIAEASLDSIASTGKVSDELMNAIMHLEMELMRWIGNFSAWINSQKNFIKALNSWLVLCLHYEPEVTADGIPPYSPGRIGAPPVFIIFNCWSQALDRVSDKEIVFAMQSSAATIKQLWQQSDMELRQKMISNRDMERLFKMREREVHSINKELDALNVSLKNQSAEPTSLQSALRQLFQSMENFATDTMKAYEDLHARAVEQKAVTEEAKTSQM